MWTILTLSEYLEQKSGGGLYAIEFKERCENSVFVKIGTGAGARLLELVRHILQCNYQILRIGYIGRELEHRYMAEQNLHEIFAEKRISPSVNQFGFKGGTEVFNISLTEVIEVSEKLEIKGLQKSLPQTTQKGALISYSLIFEKYCQVNYNGLFGKYPEDVYEKYIKGKNVVFLQLINETRFTINDYLTLNLDLGFKYNYTGDYADCYMLLSIDWFGFTGDNPFPEAPLKGTSEYRNYVQVAKEIEYCIGSFIYHQWILTPYGFYKLREVLERGQKSISLTEFVRFLCKYGVRTNKVYFPEYFDKTSRQNLYRMINRTRSRSTV